VVKLDREQTISVGVLALLLLICALAVELSVEARSDAAREHATRHDMLARLEARVRADAGARSGAVAPATAFLDAPTPGLAGAQLQAYVMQAAADHHAAVISSGVETTKREDAPDSIRLQATLDMGLAALQALLFQLESGTPYVFVESLAVQPPAAAAPGAAQDPLLRVTLGLRAIWRRGTA
jgi:hypothetical protein